MSSYHMLEDTCVGCVGVSGAVPHETKLCRAFDKRADHEGQSKMLSTGIRVTLTGYRCVNNALERPWKLACTLNNLWLLLLCA